MSDHPSDHVGPRDDAETLAALDALEGRGIRSRSSVDPKVESQADAIVEEFEAAAGALFAAWPRSSDSPAPSAGFQDRLERFVLSQVTDDVLDAFGDAATKLPAPTRSNLDTASGPRSGAPGRASGQASGQDSSFGNGRDQGPRRGSWGLVTAAGWLAAAGLLGYVLLGPIKKADGTGSIPVREQFNDFVAEGHRVEPWSSTDPERTVDGGVTWDDQLNTGFMQIAGLPANDPRVEQYQLWIFRTDDPASEPHPIDGGVFDVSVDGEVFVPIDAKLNVGHASIFAVTVEGPGGVVVSDRSRLPILASRSG